VRGDARDRINANLDACNRIENSRVQRHQAELQRRQEYDDQHGDPAIEPTGPRPFIVAYRLQDLRGQSLRQQG